MNLVYMCLSLNLEFFMGVEYHVFSNWRIPLWSKLQISCSVCMPLTSNIFRDQVFLLEEPWRSHFSVEEFPPNGSAELSSVVKTHNITTLKSRLGEGIFDMWLPQLVEFVAKGFLTDLSIVSWSLSHIKSLLESLRC